MTVTFYFIRHGQSVDNTKTTIWAGWKDSPLTNHGQRQADALGGSFACTPLTAIYASPLKRAHSTAKALAAGQPDGSAIPFVVTPDLREQGFGIAEGRTHVYNGTLDLQRGIFPVIRGRTERYPEGESRDDVRARGRRVLASFLMPHVLAARGHPAGETHVAIVSHGICIAELLGAVLERVPSASRGDYWFGGVHNTGWHAMEVGLLDEEPGVADAPAPDANAAALWVNVTHVNNSAHLASVPKAPSGLGSIPHDPNQAKITAYLAGNTRAVEVEAVE
ncbi:phosphoglycerate mutase-like protein [Auricularia subglabra TFB-10046 SS5]|nr:phosphoglycerate mutase-like protein [Auricularia subglabra TFB-10046 SS5]